MRAIATTLAALALAANAAASAESAETYRPAGPWAIDYADQSCRLARNFSDGNRTITLAFERFLAGPSLRLGIAGDDLKFGPTAHTLKFRYGPKGRERESQVLFANLSDGRQFHLITNAALLDPLASDDKAADTDRPKYSWRIEDELAAARKVDSVTVQGNFGSKFEASLGPMEAPIEALQACAADLMKGWGLDMDRMAHATRLATPTENPQRWMSSSDYPREMLAHYRQGVVGLRVIVDENGGVKKCLVDIDKPGPFELATCNAVEKHARFTPALDAEGKPMPAIYTCQVVFRLF
jgi:hypothetical protein